MSGFQKFIKPGLDISLNDDFLDQQTAKMLFDFLYKNVPWPKPHHTQKGQLSKKRNKCTYGEIKSYNIKFYGKQGQKSKEEWLSGAKTLEYKVRPWEEMPVLKEISNKLETLTGQKYHVCVLQLYNNGQVKIEPHRDKEMMSGTIIASVSLGETRLMQFDRAGHQSVGLYLKPGSLCLLNPPTNDLWLHSIPPDQTTGPRISLVFRNCANML